jgi:cytoskeletal protein CcmA (bactofilin family)
MGQSLIALISKISNNIKKRLHTKAGKDNNYNNIIAPGTDIRGRIYSPCPIKIEGMVSGEIISRGELVIGKEGKVRANIKTKKTVIEGSFTGNIISAGEVSITSTGELEGNIIQKNTYLVIKDHGLFRGNNIIIDNKEIFKIYDGEKLSAIKIKPKKILKF